MGSLIGLSPEGRRLFGRRVALSFAFFLARPFLAAQTAGGTLAPLESTSAWTAFSYDGAAWVESVLAKTVVERYSPEGFLLSSETSLLVGGVYEKADFLYSGARLLKAVYRDGTGALRRATSYAYREEGGRSLREATTNDAEGRWVNGEIQYLEPDGRVSSVAVLDESGATVLERSFRFDGRGRVVGEYAASADGSLAWVRECAYGKDDASGNWLSRTDWENYRGSWPHQRYVVRRTMKYAASPNPAPKVSP